jgi:hypothetical protein
VASQIVPANDPEKEKLAKVLKRMRRCNDTFFSVDKDAHKDAMALNQCVEDIESLNLRINGLIKTPKHLRDDRYMELFSGLAKTVFLWEKLEKRLEKHVKKIQSNAVRTV